MIVGLLTIEQKDQLIGVEVQYDWYFNPVQDGNGDWIISTQEIDNNTNPDVMWVKDLPLIEYVPLPPTEDILSPII
jgi:hypothetical protein